jgi:hypothetical protein
MLRTCSRIIALSAMVVVASTAQAAEPETLTLACEGTVTNVGDGKSEPIAEVITVNFKTLTVQAQTIDGANVGGTIRMAYDYSTTIFFYEELDLGDPWIWETQGSTTA